MSLRKQMRVDECLALGRIRSSDCRVGQAVSVRAEKLAILVERVPRVGRVPIRRRPFRGRWSLVGRGLAKLSFLTRLAHGLLGAR
jgi:hypothetical protein